MKDMYNEFRCKILQEGKLSEYIEAKNGVRQRCVLSSTMFLLLLDNVMRNTSRRSNRGIQWGLRGSLEDYNLQIIFICCQQELLI